MPLADAIEAPAPPSPPFYHYAAFSQSGVSAAGTFANLTVANPVVSVGDDHSLAEVAAQSADGRQIVEIGWIVVHGDPNPRLFVFHWVNAVPTCYDGCGFVQVSPSVFPGMTLAVSATPQRYTIEYFGGNWWLGLGSTWIGYFPGSLWTSPAFTQIGLAQWFGEVSAGPNLGCTQMGTGAYGAESGAATITGPAFIPATGTAFAASPSLNITSPPQYTAVSSGGYGGPGCVNTTITSAPDTITTDATPTFAFAADESGATFQCSLGGAGPVFGSCSGPGASHTPTSPLADGNYTFQVRALNGGANIDPSPAQGSVTVDTTPPHARVTGASVNSRQRRASFTFAADGAVRFVCKLDGHAFRPCRSPRSYGHLATGRHVFKVKGIDAVGNIDTRAARRHFKIS